ncbi:MAG: ArsA-related P-loop ATPase [Acidimicrobiales bacterium]
MSPDDYFNRTRLIIVAGKGGVGKTVVAASLARLAARTGRSTLLIEIDGRGAMRSLFNPDATPTSDTRSGETELLGGSDNTGWIRSRSITPDTALVEWLNDHGLKLVSKRLQRTGAIEVISTATPGIKDLLVLGKIRKLVHESDADLIIVDAPAAGHALTFLRAPALLLEMAQTGPIHAQAKSVLAMLSDPAMCQVMLVTSPEETPVNELIDTAFQLEDDVGIQLSPVVVNGLYPTIEGLNADLSEARSNLGVAKIAELTAAAEFRQSRSNLQAEQQLRLAEQLPLEQITLHYIFNADIGPSQIDQLATELAAGIDALHELDER